ncbi:hypothetical protein ALC57_11952 [Trachymyrmex cornetzi]|uniref:Uncharacterized protein n=1 Tax=Trachymyrmex cornetzi TaxID=471704 RepID=A0A151J1Q9_9HYME|nr:hypothetical protein ALC57_11952 [Trachymyrmex cornetzi]
MLKCAVTSNPDYLVREKERERRKMERTVDSISQVYARKRTAVSRRDARTPVPMDSANVGPTFLSQGT